uniref:Uncharacterized protein n=1 Tax=Arundo donax TaxID=35708 RepID=A0A0A9BWB6_ARUDO
MRLTSFTTVVTHSEFCWW